MKRHGRRTPPYGVPAAPLRADLAKIIDAHGYACLQWHVEDIAEIRPDLSRAKACLVLAEVVLQHDVINGVSWNTVEGIADDLFPLEDGEDAS